MCGVHFNVVVIIIDNTFLSLNKIKKEIVFSKYAYIAIFIVIVFLKFIESISLTLTTCIVYIYVYV